MTAKVPNKPAGVFENAPAGIFLTITSQSKTHLDFSNALTENRNRTDTRKIAESAGKKMKLLFMIGNGGFNSKTIMRLRQVIFEEFAKTDNYGMIFTYMWAFDQQSDWDYVEYVKNIFRPYDTEFYYVELVASRKVRLERNATENRLLQKASKRNVALSNQRLISDDTQYRLESLDGEIPFENYMKIDNTNLAPDVVAQMIKQQFDL